MTTDHDHALSDLSVVETNMLSTVARSVTHSATVLPVLFQTTRGMALQGVKGFNESEQVGNLNWS